MSARDSAAGRQIHGPDEGLGFPSGREPHI